MSSLAFGREWHIQAKLFCVRGFAGLKAVALSFGSAATVTGDSSIAATTAGPKGVGSSGAPRISDISGVLKEGLITETVREPTGNGGPNPA